MQTSKRMIGDVEVTVHATRTIIIGSGVAGLNAAEHLHELGHDDFAIVTEDIGGASGDPASAKADYYRMGMIWEKPDSPTAFAKTLCEGGMTHGDSAYVEGVNSIPEFLHLVRNGVPFPRNEYGEYTGTGKNGRTASAGPSTSAVMAEKSLERVRQSKAQIFSRHKVIALLVTGEAPSRTVTGAIAIDLRKASDPAAALVLFNCRNVILATGGPAALFADTVYPAGAPCSHGIALKAGAAASNLTETRFGLAFANARVPLAANYLRVIPNFYSVSKGGRDQRAFVADYFHATRQIASAIFLKGDHWAFSAGQLQGMGPSIVDIAVHNELAAGRRVFVDYSQNVNGEQIGQFNISQLDTEAREFLEKSQAVQFSPFDRLRHLESAAIDDLVDRKTNLREPQEVVICAEDTFGGLSVDIWWETDIAHLFAVGDVACTHGNPPDGAGLNAGQVGGLRAAERIASIYPETPRPLDAFLAATEAQITAEIRNLQRYVYGPIEAPSVRNVRTEIQARTTACAGMVRGVTGLTDAVAAARNLYDSIRTGGQRLARASEFAAAVDNELLCLTQIAFLEGIRGYIENGGGSRGAYLILDDQGDGNVLTKRGSELRHRNENMGLRDRVLQVTLGPGAETEFDVTSVPVRPIPGAAS